MEEEYEDIEDDDENQMPDTDFEDEFDDEYGTYLFYLSKKR